MHLFLVLQGAAAAAVATALPGNLTNCSACTFEMQCKAADDPGDCHWCAMPPGHGGKSYCAANGTICRRGGRLKSDDGLSDRTVPQVAQPLSAEPLTASPALKLDDTVIDTIAMMRNTPVLGVAAPTVPLNYRGCYKGFPWVGCTLDKSRPPGR